MKLRNKRTGEINILKVDEDYFNIYKDDGEFVCPVTLKELNDGWEDYEEPKDIWWLDNEGGVNHATSEVDNSFEKNREIGNYFKSKEEAEKAVEKLRAWKRLKDNGFKFEGTNNSKRKTGYFINYYLGKSFDSQEACEQAMKDLHLLFGGEE